MAEATLLRVSAALTDLSRRYPEAEPFVVTVHGAGTDSGLALDLPSPVLFWLVLALCVGWSLRRRDVAQTRRDLLAVWGGLGLLLLTTHVSRFGADSFGPAALAINVGLLLQLVLIGYLRRGREVDGEGDPEPSAPLPAEGEVLQSLPQ